MAHEPKHHSTHVQHDGEHHEADHRSHKKARPGKVIAIVAIVVIVVLGGLAWLYTGQVTSAKEKIFKALPLPAAFVDMKPMSAKVVIERIALAKQLMETQGQGQTSDPAQDYEQLIENKKLEVLARNHNIGAKQAQIDEEYRNIIEQYAGGDESGLVEELGKTYGMNADEFKDQIVRQQVLQSNLLLWYNGQQDLNPKVYDTVKGLQEKLNSGQSFDEVTKIYTQDEATKDFAGDSGMMPVKDLLPEFRNQLTDVKVGDIKVVPSRYGIHILKVLELTGEGDEKQIHLQQIFVQQQGFAEWLESETGKLSVLKLLNF